MTQQEEQAERETQLHDLVSPALNALVDLVANGYGPALEVVKKHGVEAEVEQRHRALDQEDDRSPNPKRGNPRRPVCDKVTDHNSRGSKAQVSCNSGLIDQNRAERMLAARIPSGHA